MKLSNPSILRVEFDPKAFVSCPRDRKILLYQLERLFCGEEVAEGELTNWGITVRTMPDLRAATEADVFKALDGAYVKLPITGADEVLEIWNRMLDVVAGEEEG